MWRGDSGYEGRWMSSPGLPIQNVVVDIPDKVLVLP